VILNDLRNLRLRLIVRGAVVIERQWTRERDGRHGLVRMLWPMYDAAVDARHAGDPWQIEMSEQDTPTCLGTIRYGSDPRNMDEPTRVDSVDDELIYVDGRRSADAWYDGQAVAAAFMRAVVIAATAESN